MDYKDYYKTLGVAKTATAKEIKAAFRKLARKHHPDVNAGHKDAEARFKEINEAYEVLGDPEKRKRYDELGANWGAFGGGRARPGGPGAGGWPGGVRIEYEDLGGGGGGGFSDFFRTFFGGLGGAAGGGAGEEDLFGEVASADAEGEVELTLAEVLKGTTREVRVGDGRRRVEVRIPAGVREGSRVRVAGEGGRGRGKPGDLYLRVRIAPDPAFERRGDDLATSVHVPLTAAVLGGEAKVPTLDGPVGIKIPPETPNGQVFRLRGHGLPKQGEKGRRGDLLATLAVDLPRRLTPRQKELFEELKGSGT
ncbi:MAG TPA: DnaJ C-terminal domain-containing protein [Vicinamibacteria bacterium]|nr:DnaJ C-terminal domain-containing protein [Vicinamibacteria bacterium]